METEVKAPPAQGPAEVTGTQLITLDPNQYVTAVFATFRERLDKAKEAASAVTVVDASTPDGMKTAIAHRATFRAIRVEAEKARELRKKPILDIGRLLDSRAKALEAEITPLEDRFDQAIKAEEKRKEDERQARERAETERIARIEAAIKEIRDAIFDAVGRPPGVIQEQIDTVHAINIDGLFFEFQERAAIARRETLEKLKDMHAAAVAQEAEAARLKAEREDLERLRAEADERERQAKERAFAEEQRLEAEAAARRRSLEDQERASRARIEAQEREARALREQADREAQVRRDAEVERLRGIQDRIDAENRALEEKQRQEREAREEGERQERLAQERRDREQREIAEAEVRRLREAADAEQRARDEAAREAREAELARMREEQRQKLELEDIREAFSQLRARVISKPEFNWFAKAYDTAMKAPRVPKPQKAATV